MHQDQGEQKTADESAGRFPDVGLPRGRGILYTVVLPPNPGQQDELRTQQHSERRGRRQGRDRHVRDGQVGPRLNGKETPEHPNQDNGYRRQYGNGRRAEGEKQPRPAGTLDDECPQAAADSHPEHPGGQDDPEGQLAAVKDHEEFPQEHHLGDLTDNAKGQNHRQVRRELPRRRISCPGLSEPTVAAGRFPVNRAAGCPRLVAVCREETGSALRRAAGSEG